ncbi:hypothetical protein V6N12_072892 [Hibiscus sabdariffa]|uniref:Eukaryotic translation initiation factor 4C n=1 Tax=Hibiscus sabdariffa TaxID=183260 RepID=A0ABR2B564_9ROSI
MGMGMAKGLPWLFLSSSLTITFFLTLAVAQPQPLSYFCSDTGGNFTRNSTYETSLNTLLSSFSLNASHENGFYNFSSGQGSNTANAIALCRGDVNAGDCFRCIDNANAELRNRCPNQREAIIWLWILYNRYGFIGEDFPRKVCDGKKQGARVYATSCNFRFEIARFYNLTAADTDTPSAPSPPPSNNTTTTGNKSDSSRRTIIVSISAVAFALLVISSCIFVMLRLRKPKSISQSEATEAVAGIKTAESLQYDFDTVRAATDNFSDANKLGQGGFGAVYKGTLAGGKLIAVKRLSTDSGQGDREFENEAWRNWKAGTAFDLVDPSLRDGPRTELMRCIHIGVLCVQENVAQRPNMGSVEPMLTSYSVTLPLPSEPTFFYAQQNSIGDAAAGAGLKFGGNGINSVERFEFTFFYHRLSCLHLFARQQQRKGKTQEEKVMPKNKGKGGKNRKRGKNEADDEKRELVFKEDGQEYAQVLRMLGNGRCEAMCIDGTKRLCHIRGKMHKKVWIAAGDIILVGLRDYQDDKADVILKYMPDEARLLKAYGELPENTRLNEGIVDEEDDGEVTRVKSKPSSLPGTPPSSVTACKGASAANITGKDFRGVFRYVRLAEDKAVRMLRRPITDYETPQKAQAGSS